MTLVGSFNLVSVEEITLVFVSRLVEEAAVSCLMAILPSSFVLATVRPGESALAVLLAISEFSLVLPVVSEIESAFSVVKVVLEGSLISVSVVEEESALLEFGVAQLALEIITVGKIDSTITLSLVVHKVADDELPVLIEELELSSTTFLVPFHLSEVLVRSVDSLSDLDLVVTLAVVSRFDFLEVALLDQSENVLLEFEVLIRLLVEGVDL